VKKILTCLRRRVACVDFWKTHRAHTDFGSVAFSPQNVFGYLRSVRARVRDRVSG